MSSLSGRLTAAGLAVAAITSCAHTTSGPAQTAITHPGSGPSTPSSTASAPSNIQHHYVEADAHFMTGMIAHHAQAVLMAGWAPSHGASESVQALCERIVVAQRDEILLMQNWLRDRHQPVPDADASMDMMPGMEHMLMPGMLTAEQLTQLDHARGPEFDQLFLTFMIRHHQGALTMVKDLIDTPGAARDDNDFKFVSDINADQTTEIHRMNLMLAGIPVSATSP
jgi:uncharacterized protein (DUF305 family)